MKDVTIVLQGVVHPTQIELWKKNHKNSKVIISTWEDCKFNFKGWLPKNWKLLINPYPLLRFAPTANLDYQIISTLKALYEVDTKWVIKMRADEYYSNLDKVFTKMKRSPEKLISSSMFFRKFGMYKFHCSDKLLGGTTDNLLGMFESTLHNLEMKLWDSKCPESQLGLGYVMCKDSTIDITQINKTSSDFGQKFIEEHGINTFTTAGNTISSEIMKVVTDELSKRNNGDIDWNSINNYVSRWNSILNECLNVINNHKNEWLDDRPYMKKWFDIIDINELKPYISTRNFGDWKGRVWYKDNFDNKEEECITDIEKY
mgnify:CR=1